MPNPLQAFSTPTGLVVSVPTELLAVGTNASFLTLDRPAVRRLTALFLAYQETLEVDDPDLPEKLQGLTPPDWWLNASDDPFEGDEDAGDTPPVPPTLPEILQEITKAWREAFAEVRK